MVTGYYTPVIDAKPQADDRYRYPFTPTSNVERARATCVNRSMTRERRRAA